MKTVDNMNIYEIVGLEQDPVFQVLKDMQVDDTRSYMGFEVRRSNKFYELESKTHLDYYRTEEECYFGLLDYIEREKK